MSNRLSKQFIDQGVSLQRSSKKDYRKASSKLTRNKEVKRKNNLRKRESSTQSTTITSMCNSDINYQNNFIMINREGSSSSKILRRAKRFLLQRNYQEAWNVCKQYFLALIEHEKSFGHCNSQETLNEIDTYNSVLIDVFFHSDAEKDPLQIKLVNSTSAEANGCSEFDQITAVALQSWQEIYQKSSTTRDTRNNKNAINLSLVSALDPVVLALSTKCMSLELFCVWINFWQSTGSWDEALQWNLQVLMKGSLENSNSREELLVKCLGHQLPRLQDSATVFNYCNKLIESLNGQIKPPSSPRSVIHDLDTGSLGLATRPKMESIQVIQSLWESNMETKNLLSDEAWAEIHKAWKPFNCKANTAKEQDAEQSSNNRANQHNVLTPFNHLNLSILSQSSLRMIDPLVSWIRQQVRGTIQRMIKCPQLRTQTTMSLALTMLAWRRRKVLKAFVGYLFVPFKELVDALKLKR